MHHYDFLVIYILHIGTSSHYMYCMSSVEGPEKHNNKLITVYSTRGK